MKMMRFDTKTCVLLSNVAGLSSSLWKESWQLQFLTMVSRFEMLPYARISRRPGGCLI